MSSIMNIFIVFIGQLGPKWETEEIKGIKVWQEKK